MHDREPGDAVLRRLPEEKLETLRALGAIADERGVAAYVVGGVVRDLLLDIRAGDLDVVVEEPAESFARAAADRLGGAVKAHTRFGTAILALRGLGKVDLATARSEVYERPGALPTVSAGGLEADLARRDFTINAMAVAINGESFGRFYDPHGGREDLKRGLVRVLHDGSFEDDPTRLLRAVRFAARFGFSLEERTERLLRKAAASGSLATVTGERIANEIVLILREPRPWPPVRTLSEWGILDAVVEGWSAPAAGEAVFAEIRRLFGTGPTAAELQGVEPWLVRFLALVAPLPADVRDSVLDRLRFGGRVRALAEHAANLAETLSQIDASAARPSTLRRAFDRIDVENLVLAAAQEPGTPVADGVLTYLTTLRHVRTGVTGHDVSALGACEGESIGAVLDAVLDAKLDGRVETREEELSLARRLVEELDAPTKSC